MLNEYKTTGWLASDFIRTMKMWLWTHRNVDTIIEKHFNVNNDDDGKNYNGLMCSAYLSMCDVEAPETTEKKRKAVQKHKQSMDKNTNNKDLKEIHLQPLLRSSYKIAAQVMTSDANNIENVKIHIKQHLNELHKIDQLHKKISNNDNDKPIWLSQHNNLNLLYCLPSDILRNGNVRNFWDGNGEKGIQPVKQEFVTKKGDFAGQIMKNIFTKKFMTYLTKDISYDCNTDHDINNCVIKSKGYLQGMMKQGTPIPFVVNANNENLFLIKNERASLFIFSTFACSVMGLNYFNVDVIKTAEEPMFVSKTGQIRKCVLLPTKIKDEENFIFTAITNNWYALDKSGDFEVMNDFDYKN